MEEISDLEYLQRIRELGTADIQHLSAALGKLRTQLRGLGARRTPVVLQPTGASNAPNPSGGGNGPEVTAAPASSNLPPRQTQAE